ncbi:MAG TPA: hypothetical protein VKV17_11275 [Bryobacteraceae bacterium]|nr:hypothetical protein [Bryobacteraceae bacterium]
MQGNPAVLADLQTTVGRECSLAAQYKFSKTLLNHLGYKIPKLGKFGRCCHKYSQQALQHLLLLGGQPARLDMASPRDMGGVRDTFAGLLVMESALCAPSSGEYQQMAKRAWDLLDDDSRNKFEHWIKWHGHHVDWLEKQISVINDIGESNYKTELI